MKDDQFWRLSGALGHGEERVHAERFHLGAVQNLALKSVLNRHLLRGFRKIARCTDVSREIAKPAGELHAAGDSFPLP
jgi:hypothetical protein